jgi:hypothetical protein
MCASSRRVEGVARVGFVERVLVWNGGHVFEGRLAQVLSVCLQMSVVMMVYTLNGSTCVNRITVCQVCGRLRFLVIWCR